MVADKPKTHEVEVRAQATRASAVILAGICAFMNLYAPQPLLPLLRDVFHTSIAEAGWAVSATMVGIAMAAPFVGAVADRFGRRRVILLALFGLALSTCLASTSVAFSGLIVVRFATGLLMPGVIAAVVALVSEEWPNHEAARMTGMFISGTVFGGFLGRSLAGIIAEHLGWRTAFVAIGAVTLIGAAFVARWIKEDRVPIQLIPKRLSVSDVVSCLRKSRLLAAYAVGFNILFSLVAVFTYITYRLAAPPYRLGPQAQGAVFVVYLFGVIITPLAGNLINRHGHRATAIVAFAVSSLGTLLSITPQLCVLVAGLAVCSAGVFAAHTAATDYVSREAGRSRSTAAGLYTSFYYLGGSAGAVLPGFIWTHFGWTGCVALVVGVQAVACLLTSRWQTMGLK